MYIVASEQPNNQARIDITADLLTYGMGITPEQVAEVDREGLVELPGMVIMKEGLWRRN